MSYGLEIFGADGVLQLGESSFTIRVALSILVSFAQGADKSVQSFSVPGVGPSNATAFVIPEGQYDSNQTQFETEIVDGVVRVYNYTRTYEASSKSYGTMRLIVVRWK